MKQSFKGHQDKLIKIKISLSIHLCPHFLSMSKLNSFWGILTSVPVSLYLPKNEDRSMMINIRLPAYERQLSSLLNYPKSTLLYFFFSFIFEVFSSRFSDTYSIIIITPYKTHHTESLL